MNELELLKWGAYVLLGITGWFVRVIWSAQENMKKEFSEMEKQLPLNYVRRDEFKDVVREIKEGFREIVVPFLQKVDRLEEKIEQHALEDSKVYRRRDDPK